VYVVHLRLSSNTLMAHPGFGPATAPVTKEAWCRFKLTSFLAVASSSRPGQLVRVRVSRPAVMYCLGDFDTTSSASGPEYILFRLRAVKVNAVLLSPAGCQFVNNALLLPVAAGALGSRP